MGETDGVWERRCGLRDGGQACVGIWGWGWEDERKENKRKEKGGDVGGAVAGSMAERNFQTYSSTPNSGLRVA